MENKLDLKGAIKQLIEEDNSQDFVLDMDSISTKDILKKNNITSVSIKSFDLEAKILFRDCVSVNAEGGVTLKNDKLPLFKEIIIKHILINDSNYTQLKKQDPKKKTNDFIEEIFNLLFNTMGEVLDITTALLYKVNDDSIKSMEEVVDLVKKQLEATT